MTGSFLFVKPSDQEGKRDAEDSYESPRYPYDRASWEWLLERALRRTLLPRALTESHSRVLLYGHEDQYSMHRWGSYGDKYDAGSTPGIYQNVGGPGSDSRKTDADLSDSDRETPLPGSWNSDTEVPTYGDTTVVYGIVDLEQTVANLPFSLEWLHPDWSSSALDAWDLTASTTETTDGSLQSTLPNALWTWTTTVDHGPYAIPDVTPFKCLSHMRTDDPLVTVNITNDDNKTIEVETSPTPVSAPRSTEGSIRYYHGTQARSAPYGAAYKAGWALSEFAIPYIHGLDYSDSTSSNDYDRNNKTDDTDEDGNTLGCLVDIPGTGSGAIAVSLPGSTGWVWFTHEVDWDGKPTWWHANDFPKGLDSVISPKLKEQLRALCPVCQPTIPPAVPALWEKFPDAGRLSWEYLTSRFVDIAFGRSHSLIWMRHLALACTPLDMSARLDAMTTTFHRVPTIFAKVRSETTKRNTTNTTTTESPTSEGGDPWSSSSQYQSDEEKKVTVEGTTSDPIPTGELLVSVSGQGSGTENYNETRSGVQADTYEKWSESKSTKTEYTWEESFESTVDFIVCLRSTANTTMSTKTTTTTTKTESDNGNPSISESETSDGILPDSYDPDPDDLLFPDWVLPWIETAELFASIESRLCRSTNADRVESRTTTKQDGETTYMYSGSGNGSRTHKAHRKIISLGLMDMSTGRFPAIDAAAIISGVDPDATDPTTADHYKSYDTTMTRTSDADGNYTETWVTNAKDNNRNYRSRSASYYVVVKWKFDRTDPETLKTESPLADLYRRLADAKKALSDKKRELSDAESELSDAESYLQSAKDSLAQAQKQLEDPEGAETDLIAEAKDALDRANQELSDAQVEKISAQSEYAAAEASMQSAESSLKSAQAAYDAAVAAGEGVEAARAALDSAYTAYFKASNAYSKASGRLTIATANETAAQEAAASAQDYYDTLHDKVEEILQKAVDDAQAAVDDATSRVNKWEQKVSEIEGEIPGLEAEVEAARQAIDDAIRND